MKLIQTIFCTGVLWISLSLNFLWAQNNIPVGAWKAWVSQKSCIQTTWRDGMYYTLTSGGIFSYNSEDQEIKTYSTVDGFSGLNGSTLFYDSIHDYVIIGYEDGMINYFRTPDKIEIISDIYRTQLYGNKKIYQFITHGKYLYIATGFGLVQYDMQLKETRNTFARIGNNDAGMPVTSVFVFQNKIFAATPKGLYSANLSFPNLSDSKAWSAESVMGMSASTGSTHLITGNTEVMYCNYADTIYSFSASSGWAVTTLETGTFNSLDFKFGVLCATFGTRINALYPDGFLIKANSEKPMSCFPDPQKNRQIYINDYYKGWWVWDNFYEFTIPISGPENNFSTEVATGNSEFYIAPRGYGVLYDKSGIFYFDRLNGWKNLSQYNGLLTPGKNDMDYVCADYDPVSGTVWMGSFQQGIAQLRKGELIAFYDGTNSGIRGRTKINNIETDIRVHDLKLDTKGNVWFTTEFSPTPLQVKTTTGYWYAFPLQTNPDNVKTLEIDDAGYKWIAVEGLGIIVYDDKNTPETLSQHRQKVLGTAAGQGALPSTYVNAIVKDKNGRIWIGTSTGVAVFNNPRSVFSSSNFDAQRPVFNRRPLFTNESVTSIAVDGQNRKWIGTRNGVFLMSEDGTEQLAQYNMENSPLFSNNIISITINGKTGEVFICTDLGLISFMSDATDPEDSCKAPEIFPNPWYPENGEPIAFRGAAENSMVKITTETGLLVKEVETRGGQAVWDGKDVRGNLVMPGVYLIFAADTENKNACISKLAIIPKP